MVDVRRDVEGDLHLIEAMAEAVRRHERLGHGERRIRWVRWVRLGLSPGGPGDTAWASRPGPISG
jgi:hypothetical protein